MVSVMGGRSRAFYFRWTQNDLEHLTFDTVSERTAERRVTGHTIPNQAHKHTQPACGDLPAYFWWIH